MSENNKRMKKVSGNAKKASENAKEKQEVDVELDEEELKKASGGWGDSKATTINVGANHQPALVPAYRRAR
jgi:hypothetical protein